MTVDIRNGFHGCGLFKNVAVEIKVAVEKTPMHRAQHRNFRLPWVPSYNFLKFLDATGRRRRNHMKNLNGPSEDELQKFLQARSK